MNKASMSVLLALILLFTLAPLKVSAGLILTYTSDPSVVPANPQLRELAAQFQAANPQISGSSRGVQSASTRSFNWVLDTAVNVYIDSGYPVNGTQSFGLYLNNSSAGVSGYTFNRLILEISSVQPGTSFTLSNGTIQDGSGAVSQIQQLIATGGSAGNNYSYVVIDGFDSNTPIPALTGSLTASGSLAGFALKAYGVDVVPEPSTWALLSFMFGCGLIYQLMRNRRWKNCIRT